MNVRIHQQLPVLLWLASATESASASISIETDYCKSVISSKSSDLNHVRLSAAANSRIYLIQQLSTSRDLLVELKPLTCSVYHAPWYRYLVRLTTSGRDWPTTPMYTSNIHFICGSSTPPPQQVTISLTIAVAQYVLWGLDTCGECTSEHEQLFSGTHIGTYSKLPSLTTIIHFSSP